MKYILIFFVLISCKVKNDNKYSSKEELCNVINKLNEDDQKFRGSKEMSDPFFEILDSIKQSEGLDHQSYGNLSDEEQLAYGRKARTIANKLTKVSKKITDSLMRLQIELDNKNTEILLDIFKKVGYPNIDTLPCSTSPDLIFLHSQKKYWKKIETLINKEYKLKHLNDFKYGMWLRHIKGSKKNNLQILIDNENN